MDAHNEFLQNTSLGANQLKKNMAVNIYKNGQWGTYRHLLLNKLNDDKKEHCFAYVGVRGDLSSIKWMEGPLRHDAVLAPQNKLAYVYYAALNYRDIMIALGKIGVDFITKDRREQECVQGLEFSGRDERGNRIMGMVNTGALSTLVLPDSTLTFKVPDHWTLAEAATVPAVYLTVLYALCIRGEIKRSETILIHSGAGGIGLAAIHLALHHGCTVFTTVGSQDKRIFLKETFPQLDDHHIGNSRDESFVEMIFKGTNGRGVDVVLNFLADEKLLASVRCLASGGRFIEIGKCDLASNNQMNLLLFKKNASFQGVMLDMLFSPHRKLALSKLMNEGIQSGAIKPLNKIIFKFSEVEQAFRFMASSKHIGKILIQIREPENEIASFPSIQKYNCTQRYLCDPEMVYIIVGGLGGFGLELADWLVLRGAKKLVLNSPNGISTGYQNFRIKTWESYGTIVKISKCNTVSQSGCQQLIKESQELGSITAVFNLAIVLNDSIFENQTPESFYTVFAPKAFSTQYLDEVTRKLCPSLRDFVVFSSVTCGRGLAGQTNYGMANSVLERICETRKRDGYPALAIEWGLIGDVGLVAQKEEEQHIKPVNGTLPQKISSCLKVLDIFLRQKDEIIVSSMVVAEKRGAASADSILDAVANVLGINDLKTISLHSTLPELGMDSLTSAEIRHILERDHEVNLSAKDMRAMTFARLKQIQIENDVKYQSDVSTDVTAFGMENILRIIGTESETRLLQVKLTSKVDKETLSPKLLLFPGLEGVSKVYEPLAVRLRAHIICVQYTYYNTNATIEHIAKSLLPFIEEYITENETFQFLAYSYGVLVAMEVVNILESKGYTGTIVCLDGSPLMMKQISNNFNFQSEENLQTSIIYQVLSILVPNNIISSHKETFFKCNSWEDRLNLLYKITRDYSLLEKNYQRTLVNGIYERIKALNIYNPSYSKLKSKVKLYKAKEASIRGLPEDHELSQLFENPVEVKIFEGNHVTIMNNEFLAETINLVIKDI